MREQRSRRDVLSALGAGAAVGMSALAGCSSNNSEAGSSTTASSTAATPTIAGAESTATSSEPGTGTDSGIGSQNERTVTDMAGREVTVPGGVERVVALGSGGLRFVTYTGGAGKVVAVEQLETTNEDRPFRPYTLANDRYTELPPVGTRKSPSPERILQREPDVVVYGYASASDADTMQNQLGVPVVIIRPGGLTPALREQFFRALTLTGQVIGTPDAAMNLRSYVQKTLSDLQQRRKSVSEAPTGYVGYLGRGNHGLTFTQPGYVPFEFGGVTNVAADATGTEGDGGDGGGGSGNGGGGGSGNGGGGGGGDGSGSGGGNGGGSGSGGADGGGGGGGGGSGDGSGGGDGGGGGGGGGGGDGRKGATRVEIDPETLIQWDPRYLFVDLGTETYEELSAPEYESITAIQNGDVYGVLPTRDYGTNFATMLADAYYVGSVANAEAFDVDPVAKANELYEAFVGEGVYQDVAEGYGRGFGEMSL